MARFPRPAGAIKDINDIHVGDILYEVHGIWPPFVRTEPVKVCSEPMRFQNHPSYDDVYELLKDLMVFDVECTSTIDGETYTHMGFATDGNLVPGYSHNDNYWFRSLEEAIAATGFLRQEWEKRPDLVWKNQK